MIKANVSIELFHLNELSAAAREKAIEQHRVFELSSMSTEYFISGDPQYDTEEELEKAFRAEYEYYEMNDEPIIENIEANDYLFFSNGELAHTIQYCGNHPQHGETHFIFQGNDYRVA